jgi:signal transduction histidine kinase
MEISQVFQSISNPLTSVGLLLQTLVRELDNLQVRMDERGLHRAVRTAEVLQLTFGELQDMARSASNLASNHSVEGPVQVDGPLMLAVQLMRPKLVGRAAVVADLNEPPAVDASPTRLCQAFVGLLAHASHLLGDGSPEGAMMRVTSRRESEHTFIEIAVTGPSVAVTNFAEGSNDAIDIPSASAGEGMSIAGLLAAELGGMLSTDCEPGVGAWFRLRLPAG